MKNENLSHEQLVEITTSSLCTLFQTDSLLRDLPSDITIEEIESKIALEYGQSITVTLMRNQETPLEIIVPQISTVTNLKKAIKRQFSIYQNRCGYHKDTKISWKYIWRTYNLSCAGQLLIDHNATISSYGVLNKSVIKFVKKKLPKKFKYQPHSSQRL